MPQTSLEEVDEKVANAVAARPIWVRLSARERAALLRECIGATSQVADQWAEVMCRIKGYAPESNGHGEEMLAGTLAVLSNLRLFAEALEHDGEPPLPKTWQRPDGQWVARVFPQSLLDRAMLGGVTCDVWIEPGHEPTQGRVYRDKRAGTDGNGGVGLVLGAGNNSSIPMMDVLYKLVVEDEVCVLKMNPVNEAFGPVLEQAFAPLLEPGFVQVCYGGVEVGKHLTDHPDIDTIHITGSQAVHDAIVWGPGEEGAANKEQGTPRTDKPVTSELGAVSPLLVVPGEWSDKELDFHAAQVAGMLTYNCGFNCNGVRVVVVASGWSLKESFLDRVRSVLRQTPTRLAYYPRAQETWERFTSKYDHSALGEVTAEGALPWTVLESVQDDADEYALNNEPWCGIFSFVELEASGPAEFLPKAVQFANDKCYGTLSAQVLISPKSQAAVGEAWDQAIADLRYGIIAINCWSGLNYGLVQSTWGAFPGHPLDDIQSGRGVVHNGLLLDHPQKSVVTAPFVIQPKPAWSPDHRNLVALGRTLVAFEANRGWLGLPKVALTAFKG